MIYLLLDNEVMFEERNQRESNCAIQKLVVLFYNENKIMEIKIPPLLVVTLLFHDIPNGTNVLRIQNWSVYFHQHKQQKIP